MVWPHLLLAMLLATTSGTVGPMSSGECTVIQINSGTCSIDASVGSDDVTLTGTATSPGSGGGASTGSRNAGTQSPQCEVIVETRCRAHRTRPAVADPVVQPVTLRDIASFRPAPGMQRMEPNGWVVPGLDANFYSVVDQQLVTGTLLGRPATVRFTPVGWHWNYGDGSAVVRATKGATWAAQGLHEFDRTPTSHVYETEGEYVIRLSIDFQAEYRFGSAGFTPLVGTINLPANNLRVTVSGAKTVLVDHDCLANPAGPGC